MHYYWSGKFIVAVVLLRTGPPPNLVAASDVNNGRSFGFGCCTSDQYLKLLRNYQMVREASATQLSRECFVACLKIIIQWYENLFGVWQRCCGVHTTVTVPTIIIGLIFLRKGVILWFVSNPPLGGGGGGGAGGLGIKAKTHVF